jgi:hypothetical protein
VLLHYKSSVHEIPNCQKIWPQVIVEGHIKKVKGGIKGPVSLSGFQGLKKSGTHTRFAKSCETQYTFLVECVVTSVGHVDVSWRLVLVRIGVTPKKDLWIDTCVLRIPAGNQRVNQTQRGD